MTSHTFFEDGTKLRIPSEIKSNSRFFLPISSEVKTFKDYSNADSYQLKQSELIYLFTTVRKKGYFLNTLNIRR